MRRITHFQTFKDRLERQGFQKDPSQHKVLDGYEGRFDFYYLDLIGVLEVKLWVNETARSIFEDSKWNFYRLKLFLKEYQRVHKRMDAMVNRKSIPYDETISDAYIDFMEKQYSPLVNHLNHSVPDETTEKSVSALAFALPALSVPDLQHMKKNEFNLLFKLMSIVNEAYGDFAQEHRGRPKGIYNQDVREEAIRLLTKITIEDHRLRRPSKKEERIRRVAEILQKSPHTIKKFIYSKVKK